MNVEKTRCTLHGDRGHIYFLTPVSIAVRMLPERVEFECGCGVSVVYEPVSERGSRPASEADGDMRAHVGGQR